MPFATNPAAQARVYRCYECKSFNRLCDLNDHMVCEACEGPEEDDQDFDPTADELLRTECTWSV